MKGRPWLIRRKNVRSMSGDAIKDIQEKTRFQVDGEQGRDYMIVEGGQERVLGVRDGPYKGIDASKQDEGFRRYHSKDTLSSWKGEDFKHLEKSSFINAVFDRTLGESIRILVLDNDWVVHGPKGSKGKSLSRGGRIGSFRRSQHKCVVDR